MKQFSCGDVVSGCDRTFRAKDDDELLAAVAAHARADHGLTVVPDSLLVQIRQHVFSAA